MIIQEGKFTYSSFGKEFGKQRKTIEDQVEKRVEALHSFDLINQQTQPYHPQKRSFEDIFQMGKLNQNAMNKLKKLFKLSKELKQKIYFTKLLTLKEMECMLQIKDYKIFWVCYIEFNYYTR